MRYCKMCGSEIPEGAGFCSKCGNPVGKVSKPGKGKRGVLLAGSAAVVAVAAAVAGIFFLAGNPGHKQDTVYENRETVIPQESPGATENVVAAAETESPVPSEKDYTEARDKAWEAFDAYKAEIESEYEEIEEAYEEDMEDDSDTITYSMEDYKSAHGYCMIYLDEDDYPELIIYDSFMSSLAKNYIWTYKDGVITQLNDFVNICAYREREGYFYHLMHGLSGMEFREAISQLRGTDTTKLIQEGWESKDGGEFEPYGYQALGEKAGLEGGSWIEITELFNTKSIDEAFLSLVEDAEASAWGSSADTQAASANEKALQAFANALRSGEIEYHDADSTDSQGSKYCLCDIDRDGVEELIIEVEPSCYQIWKYEEGKVSKQIDFMAEYILSYDPKTNTFWETGEGDGGWANSYQWEGGELVQTASYIIAMVETEEGWKWQAEKRVGEQSKKISRARYDSIQNSIADNNAMQMESSDKSELIRELKYKK